MGAKIIVMMSVLYRQREVVHHVRHSAFLGRARYVIDPLQPIAMADVMLHFQKGALVIKYYDHRSGICKESNSGSLVFRVKFE